MLLVAPAKKWINFPDQGKSEPESIIFTLDLLLQTRVVTLWSSIPYTYVTMVENTIRVESNHKQQSCKESTTTTRSPLPVTPRKDLH